MQKKNIKSIRQKNRIINNIIEAMATRHSFLILGHKNPDEDCMASMSASALLVKKFYKDVQIFIGKGVHEHFQYLLNICTYNSIRVLKSSDKFEDTFDTVIFCDTPKPSMIELNKSIQDLLSRSDLLKIEIDHHIDTDSEYLGDREYCLVSDASSASELIGQILLKLKSKSKLLREFNINDLVSRNLVLAILTGIVGDTKMGAYLKSRKEKRYYQIFSAMFNDFLAEKTDRATNFSNMDEVFHEIQKLSTEEEIGFNYFIQRKKLSAYFGYVAITLGDMEHLYNMIDKDVIISVARAMADNLAEESSRLSLVVYYDNPIDSDLIQFRIRRSKHFKEYDLRKILKLFNIKDGGGHEGAIGFRFKREEIPDLNAYVTKLINGIENGIEDDIKKTFKT